MLGTRLIIKLAHELSLVGSGLLGIMQFSARIIRTWKAGGEFHRRGTKLRRINAVVHKGSLQRDLPARVAGWRSEGREVACQHCGCRNERPRVAWVLA